MTVAPARPELTPEDEQMFERLMSDPGCESFVGDLRQGYREGKVSKEQFLMTAARRMVEVQRLVSQAPPALPADLAVDTDEIVAVVAKRPEARGPIVSKKTLTALNGLLSGPASSEENRAVWPERVRNVAGDPVVAVKVVENALCLAFASDADAEVWCWKMNYEVFANEGAGMLYTKNMRFNMFRLPLSLSHLLQHVVNGVVHAVTAGSLTLAPGEEDKRGRYEPGRGSPELLSEWLERTTDRLRGRVQYTTADAHEE